MSWPRQIVTHATSALLGAGLTWWIVPQAPAAEQARAEAGEATTPEERTTLRAEIATLERERAALKAANAALRAQLPGAAKLPSAPGAAPTSGPSEVARTRDQDVLAHVELVHESQPRTPSAWGGKLEGRVRALLKSPNFAESTLQRVDCRETLCRMEFAHADDEAAERFQGDLIEQGLTAIGGEFVNQPHTDDDGNVVTTVIIAKPPHRLPLPPDQAGDAPAVIVTGPDQVPH